MPTEWLWVVANPPDNPVIMIYDASMPIVLARNRRRRPTFSALSEPAYARNKFQTANPPLIPEI